MKTNATSYDRGQQAETAAAQYLQAQGFEILGRNWRTARCEIDIIACKDGCVYFVEVKYRRSDDQGGGLDYISASKLRQMQFAANMWIARYNWRGEYALSAVEVTADFQVNDFIQNIF